MPHFITMTEQIAVTNDILYVTLDIGNVFFSISL
jgi:hypothetical protein